MMGSGTVTATDGCSWGVGNPPLLAGPAHETMVLAATESTTMRVMRVMRVAAQGLLGRRATRGIDVVS